MPTPTLCRAASSVGSRGARSATRSTGSAAESAHAKADVLLVAGGDATYLCHWMRQSGLADLLPSLQDTVWVGLSAGSMVLTPRIGADFVEWEPPSGDDRTLGVVDFSIFPHLGLMPENTMAGAERWAAEIAGPAYAIDDQTAIKVTDGTVEVVSEGHWKLFPS
jgi:dipeptidase E